MTTQTPPSRRRDRASQPSPIANSPLKEAAASGSARSSSSSAYLSDLFVGTSSLYQDPGPGPAAPEPEPEPEPQTSASPIPAEDAPLPPVDNTAAGPGAFTDDVDSLPSDPILGSVTGDTGDLVLTLLLYTQIFY